VPEGHDRKWKTMEMNEAEGKDVTVQVVGTVIEDFAIKFSEL